MSALNRFLDGGAICAGYDVFKDSMYIMSYTLDVHYVLHPWCYGAPFVKKMYRTHLPWKSAKSDKFS